MQTANVHQIRKAPSVPFLMSCSVDGTPSVIAPGSPLHRTILMMRILPIRRGDGLQHGVWHALVVFLDLQDVEVLEREMVVVELELATHRLEIRFAQRRTHS